MKLFDDYPFLEDEFILLKRPGEDSAEALDMMTRNEKVYRFLPTFLHELQYEDKREAIRTMYDDCFLKHISIHLGIYLKEDDSFVGLVELYNLDEEKKDVLLGIRIDEAFWNRGLAKRSLGLTLSCLKECENVKTVSVHIMTENKASLAVVEKLGFVKTEEKRLEDWGFEEKIPAEKYSLQLNL